MTAPIDPIRRTARLGRAKQPRTDRSEDSIEASERLLPVPVDAPQPASARAGGATKPETAFAAQLLGQDGQRRGLRGGPAVLDAAKVVYSRTEWSGAADRRAPKGRGAKTEA